MVKSKLEGIFAEEGITVEDNPISRTLYDKSRMGEINRGKFKYSLQEALYLLECNKLIIFSTTNKELTSDEFLKKARKIDKNFWIRYLVFKDLRSRGYIVKTALKFGADFRVYDKGIKPGEDHAKWVVFPVHESNTLTWHDFSAKNRVSHSTRKKLLMAIVDNEDDVTYYEIAWKKP
ncbi:tRNA-intron lyase [Candidatus Woesearchaeota archaeon]|jgi:tRNA-intron endonuclease|nr:tRNA-intron lyase [Candidatus Woesearchaeota archaeon]MBT3438775.1 tRNA-intron lyase [Candidatus Woesearchaeota archaeon]MBT4057987.1 tRNA-intron lyase [Candidatus Woesearchaeota archaeon]MBT4208738.1 tRNA-intron lyase [Candidatus Woesearchaeota archaeon]MBT4733173.1 tRNA-intron lyase [Candidatus Woesearchaeota archaeon]